jgi:acyl-coenzyme A synthetase/AMP-(fatty) acid ligase/acyl carrier protein
VPIGQRNLCPLLHWGYRHIGINPGDRVAQNLSFYFDWSVWEIFITLTSGALLCLVDRETLLDGWKYTALLNREKITVLHITPTQYQYLVASGQKLPYLRILSLGAEKLSIDLVQRGLGQVGPGCRVFNMYGPTEATIMAAVLEIDRSRLPEYNDLSSVPIGRSISNTGLLILNRYRRLCPVKVAGELFIAGDGLAGGYLNNPELTAEKFISAPLHGGEGMGVRLDRLYKTGDLARWLEDGSIEFLGRVDFQVKIRGLRIELGEIETQLRKHPDIKEAVVLVRQAGEGDPYLCAYLVMGPGQAPGKESLRRFLAKNLPVYMIPAYFIDVPLMPLNPNGKIDIEKLPAPEIGIGRDFIPPGNELEQLLVEIWSEILDVPRDKIGIDTDFFELGGHSLKAVLVQMQIEKRLDIYISSTELFKTRTIQGVASLITAIRWVSDELPESSGDKQEEVII